MASYQARHIQNQNQITDGDQTNASSLQDIVKLHSGPQCTARDNIGEIYEFRVSTKEPTRDLKGGACRLHLESGSCSFPARPSPLNSKPNCECQWSCSQSQPRATSLPCFPCPPSLPVESCLPGLHQQHRDSYPECKESHLANGYQNFVEHDDLYLPPRPLSSASNYCNRPTSSRSWSPPSPPAQQKCHCGAAQYQVRPRPTWDMHISESKPCFQTFFHASPRGSTPTHPDRCESLYLVEEQLGMSPIQPQSRSTSPTQPYLKSCLSPQRSGVGDWMSSSCQCSPRIDEYSAPKSFQTKKSVISSPLSPCIPEPSPYPSPCSPPKRTSPYSPSSPSAYYPPKPMGLPEPSSRHFNRLPYAAEIITMEKHIQCNCTHHVESADEGQLYNRRPVSPSLYDSTASIRRILRPESPTRTILSNSRHLECTCPQKPAKKSYKHYPAGNGSQSPSQSSTSTAQHRNGGADLQITTFLNDVKRVLTSDVPPLAFPTDRNSDWKEEWKENRQQDWKQDLKEDFHSCVRSTLKSDFPSRDFSSSGRTTDRKQEYSSSGRNTHRRQENNPSTDFFSSVRSTLTPALPSISSSGRATDRKQDYPSRDNFASNERKEQKQEFPARDNFDSSGRTTEGNQPWEFPSSRRTEGNQAWEFPSSGRTDREKAQWEPPPKQAWEFPTSEKTTDQTQAWKFPTKLDWSYPSMNSTDRKQEYSSCVKTTERGSSPIIVTPTMIEPGLSSGAGIVSGDRPRTTPTNKNFTNCSEAPSKRRPLQSGNDRWEEMKRSALQANISPAPESDEDYRYGPVQAIPPKAADLSVHPSKRNFNKRDTSPRLPRAAPNQEVTRRCCCGMCKSTYSRSHFTTKCPFCANVHSCCCGMCSCPFPSCTSKSPIPESNTSNYTSTTGSSGNDKLPFHNHNPSHLTSRPKSLSPMRRTYLAGLERPDKHGPRSKSSRSKRFQHKGDFEPSPRALLESFHNYLKKQSRRSKTSLSPNRRCSERRSPHWHPPATFPDRNCSQRARRLNTRGAPREPQAPCGTHPILLSSRPSNMRALECRLPYSGFHRGCCCPQCINGKL